MEKMALVQADVETDVHVKRHKSEKTSLLLTSQNGDIITVRALITAGADINAANTLGETPLHQAAFNGHKEIVELLIEAGADINATNVDEETLLCLRKRTILALWLLETGNGDYARNRLRGTPLYQAALNGHKEIVELLIEAGADINAANRYRETPLYTASSEGHREIAQWLIEKGADINAVDDYATIAHNVQPSIIEQIVRLEAAGLHVSEKILKKMDEFMNTHERHNKYLQHSIVCKEEVNKLKRENIMLYRLLMESEIDQLCSIWEKSESAFSNFNNPDNLKDQYPEYAYILINKANEVRKEIFLHNHRPLVDALSIHYECDVKRITFAGMKHFFNIHSVDFKEKLGSGGLTLCSFVDLQDVKERHIPKLKALAFETFLSKCCMKKKI